MKKIFEKEERNPYCIHKLEVYQCDDEVLMKRSTIHPNTNKLMNYQDQINLTWNDLHNIIQNYKH